MGIELLGFQTTIASPVTLRDIGVHSGAEVEITFHPAEADAGIVFQRVLANGRLSEFKAVSSQVGNTDLC
ncbi:MAG: UDP-3-O-acyl-N-acetylglucosamine deacetylase, partial [Ensifer adhaerens]